MPSGSALPRFPLAPLAALLLGACAAPGSDVHLAPFYTRSATADGGELVEVAGGLYRQHRRAQDGFLQWLTLAPLYGIERWRNGDYAANHPFLLGYTRHRSGETVSYLVPLYLGWSREAADGTTRGLVATLPGFLRQEYGGETHWGWFPFYARFENVLTFDEAAFVLWPLYVTNDRSGRVSHHVLWPIVGWTRGGGESSWHVWPLVGRASWEDRYDRTYVLWPFFHFQKNHLGGGGEEPERVWWLFPFIGKSERGSYRAWSWLWPFFGFSSDSRSDFWSLDFLFPFVRLQRGPDGLVRTRFWPFYSHLEAEGLDTTSWLWPLIFKRQERSSQAERDSLYVIPFWQSWERRDLETGEESSYAKLWPLLSVAGEGHWQQGAVLELDPFFKNTWWPRYLTSFFHLWEWEQEPAFRRERSFLGLYRRERGRGEDRRSVAGIWARRTFQEQGREVRETSLLFGLLRWRVTADEGFDMLRPAFPGPGWPRPAEAGAAPRSRSFF